MSQRDFRCSKNNQKSRLSECKNKWKSFVLSSFRLFYLSFILHPSSIFIFIIFVFSRFIFTIYPYVFGARQEFRFPFDGLVLIILHFGHMNIHAFQYPEPKKREKTWTKLAQKGEWEIERQWSEHIYKPSVDAPNAPWMCVHCTSIYIAAIAI